MMLFLRARIASSGIRLSFPCGSPGPSSHSLITFDDYWINNDPARNVSLVFYRHYRIVPT